MQRWVLFLLAVTLPFAAFAEAPPLTRREGYLLIWNAIRRQAEETGTAPFPDVPEGSEGSLEITYGKDRGILDDDEERFRPDEILTFGDALLWLFRTRNVDELPAMRREDLGTLMARYPVTGPDADPAEAVPSASALTALMRSLDERLAREVHEVSFYGDEFHGDGTAFGEVFDMHALTAAHRSLPQDTLVHVTNVENGKAVVVRINDRGPYVPGRDMDLSRAAFARIAEPSRGVLRAVFQRLGDSDFVDPCENHPRRYQKRITRDVRFHRGIPHMFTLGGALVLQANRWFVLRGLTYPDGRFVRLQDFVGPDDRFTFAPSEPGLYRFLVGTPEGRVREMRMTVGVCKGRAE